MELLSESLGWMTANWPQAPGKMCLRLRSKGLEYLQCLVLSLDEQCTEFGNLHSQWTGIEGLFPDSVPGS